MFEVDVKYVIEQQQGRSRTSLGLGFWFIAALCTMISPSPPPPHSCAQRFFPPGKFTLSVKPHPHFKMSPTLKSLPLLKHHHLMSTFKTYSTSSTFPIFPPPCSQHICIVILCPIAAMVNGGNIKNVMEKKGRGQASFFSFFKWQQMNVGVLKDNNNEPYTFMTKWHWS